MKTPFCFPFLLLLYNGRYEGLLASLLGARTLQWTLPLCFDVQSQTFPSHVPETGRERGRWSASKGRWRYVPWTIRVEHANTLETF